MNLDTLAQDIDAAVANVAKAEAELSSRITRSSVEVAIEVAKVWEDLTGRPMPHTKAAALADRAVGVVLRALQEVPLWPGGPSLEEGRATASAGLAAVKAYPVTEHATSIAKQWILDARDGAEYARRHAGVHRQNVHPDFVPE
ncbi:hypothetical protein N9M39_00290 [Halieaceae bacterium]|nr:hypothetical protein [Halieaceae bacterium]